MANSAQHDSVVEFNLEVLDIVSKKSHEKGISFDSTSFQIRQIARR